jgi:hypothetical protein
MFEEDVKKSYGYSTDYSKPPSQPSPALTSAAYTGTYHNDYFGDMEIVEQNGALQLLLGPKKRSTPLRHWNRDVFTYQPEGENAGGLSGVTFRIGPEGKATSMVIENLDVFGQGDFVRTPLGK